MKSPNHHHLTVGGDSWCERSGSTAGAAINEKAGRVLCGHLTKSGAERGAKALRPHFRRGVVRVVAGQCPHEAN